MEANVECRNLIRISLVLYRASIAILLNPMLGIRSHGLLNQVPTLTPPSLWGVSC